MIQIVYRSRAAVELTQEDLRDLIQVSRTNNERDGVTGLLLYDGYRFVQAIEGPEAAIAACYDRIVRDPRHSAVELVLREPVRTREFGSFAMTALSPGPAGKDIFVAEVKRHLEQVSAPHLQALFIGFAVLA